MHRTRRAFRVARHYAPVKESPVGVGEALIELFFVLAFPPMFFFYLCGWRPFTGRRKEHR